MKLIAVSPLLLSLCILFSIGTSAQAQTAKADFESAKIAYLTQQVKLTPEQASAFWPVYNEFSGKRQVIKKAIRQSRQRIANENSNEEVVKQQLLAIQQKKQEELTLENEYLPKFLKVISASQVATLAKAERAFLIESVKKLPDSSDTDE